MRAVASIRPRRDATRIPVPRNDQVIIREHPKAEEISKGGIILPDAGDQVNMMVWAEVIAVGPGGITSDGTRVPINVKPGDTVGVAPNSHLLFTLSGIQYGIVTDGGILVILSETADGSIQ